MKSLKSLCFAWVKVGQPAERLSKLLAKQTCSPFVFSVCQYETHLENCIVFILELQYKHLDPVFSARKPHRMCHTFGCLSLVGKSKPGDTVCIVLLVAV